MVSDPQPAEPPDEDIAPAANSLFDDPEIEITDKLHRGMTSLEAAIAAPPESVATHAEEARVKFSEARGLLIREKRNIIDDPGWTLANHGTAVSYILLKNFRNALIYLKRLPSPPDRAALLNHVVVLLHTREQKADAIRMLLEHLTTPTGADDGYALNLLGTALARYPEDVIKQDKMLNNARQKYDEIVKRQSGDHPGEKRWGVRWIPIREWEALDKQRRIDANQIETRERALTKVRSRIADARLPHQKAHLPAYQTEEARLLAEIETIRAKMPAEEWLTPEQIVPILPDVTAVNSRSAGAGGGGAETTQPTTGG